MINKDVMFSHLVEIFPGEERLVAGVLLEQGGEGGGLLALLPGFAAAVALQGVVGDAVVVRVLPRQDAGSAGAAQRTGHKLRWKQQPRLSEPLLLHYIRATVIELTAFLKDIPASPISFLVFLSGVWREKGASNKLPDCIMKTAVMLINEQKSVNK